MIPHLMRARVTGESFGWKTDELSGPGLLLIGAVSIVYGQFQWNTQRFSQGLPWMILGILLAALAPPVLLDRRSGPNEGQPRLRGLEIAFLLALTLAAGVARFVGLDHLPPGGFYDEVEYHRIATQIIHGARPVFVPDIQLPALFIYWLAAAIVVAGKGLATVRGAAALLGTLTIPAFYFLARRAFSRPVAMAAAILLAGSRWHITFSRVVFSAAVTAPLLEVLAILLLWRAAERGKRLDYLLLGVVVGLGLQTYYSFVFFPAVLAVATLAYAGRAGLPRFRTELLRIVRGLAWSVLVAIVLLLPLARFAARRPKVFFERPSTVAIWNPEHQLPWPGILFQNTATHLLMFNYRGDVNPRHNIPDQPMLDSIEGVLFALGIGLTLPQGRRWPQIVWLAWFGVMLLPAILTIEAPQAHRAVGAIPAVCLLLATALEELYRAAAGGRGRLGKAAGTVLVIALAGAAVARDVWLYFHVQVRHPLAWQAFETDEHEVAKFIQPLAGKYEIRVSALYYRSAVVRFHVGDEFPYQRFRLADELPRRMDGRQSGPEGTVYVLEPVQGALFPIFRSLYPHARMQEFRDPFGRLMFVAIFVPREELNQPSDPDAVRRGFLGVYYPNEEWLPPEAIARRDPAVLFHFHWEAEALAGSFTADWAAHVQVEKPGLYTFEFHTSGPSLVLVDNQTVIETREIDQESDQLGLAMLSAGEHRIVVRYLKKGYFSTIRLLWGPPSSARSVIPLRSLRPFSLEEYSELRKQLPVPRPPE